MSEATLQETLRAKYETTRAELCKEFNITNSMAAPRITKVCLNMGVGRAIADGQILNVLIEHMSLIAGQKACATTARKSIAQFRSRQGQKIGCRVTLRKHQMWAFMDKMVSIAIPRIRDFRGISPKAFDKQGNYNLGFTEQAIFPEVVLDQLNHNQGLQVTVCIENSTPEQSLFLLKGMGLPFRER